MDEWEMIVRARKDGERENTCTIPTCCCDFLWAVGVSTSMALLQYSSMLVSAPIHQNGLSWRSSFTTERHDAKKQVSSSRVAQICGRKQTGNIFKTKHHNQPDCLHKRNECQSVSRCHHTKKIIVRKTGEIRSWKIQKLGGNTSSTLINTRAITHTYIGT